MLQKSPQLPRVVVQVVSTIDPNTQEVEAGSFL